MSEVTSGGVPAENPFSLSQEESITPDTPLRGEGIQETLAVMAKENGEVTISKKGFEQLLQMLDITFKSPVKEITPSVPPLASEPKVSDAQEKKAAPDGENEQSIAELAEALGAFTARIAQRQKGDAQRTSVQETPSFPMTVSPEQSDSGYGPRITQVSNTKVSHDREENARTNSNTTRFNSGIFEVEDDDGEETKEQSPVIIAVKKAEGFKEALDATTSNRMIMRTKNAMLEIVIGKTKFMIPVICLFGSEDGEKRRAMLNSMGTIIEKEHTTSLGSAPTTEAIRRCLANGMKIVMTATTQALGDALAEKASSEATVAADAIQQDVEQTRLKEFDLHAFASQGVGGLERYVSIIARVIFKINPEQLQDEAHQLEKQTAKHCKLGHVNLVKMIQMQQQSEVIRAEGTTINEIIDMKDPISALTALVRMTPSTAFAREHMLIGEFIQKIKGQESYINRVEIAMATQDQINRIREADASTRGKVPKKTDVLVATTTQTKSDEGTAADDSETKPLKENKPSQRSVKRQEVEMKVVRKHGLCRKQLMNIIREKMTPKEAMEACQKGRNDGQCKFCKSCGEIKPEFVQMAKDILGSKDDEEATAEQK